MESCCINMQFGSKVRAKIFEPQCEPWVLLLTATGPGLQTRLTLGASPSCKVPSDGSRMDPGPPGSSSSSSASSGTSSFELVSSHLHRLQLDFNLAESRLRVVEDRLDLLERGQQHQESRLRWVEALIARLRALFSWGR